MPKSQVVLQITRYGMGHGEPELQLKLLQKYLQLILENGSLPMAITFYTEGVKLTVEGSPVLKELHALEKQGVRLVICSTCLDYYGLHDGVQVGIVGGMPDIIEAQWKAEKLINL